MFRNSSWKSQRSPCVHAQGVHEVPYNNSWKRFIIRVGTVTGQVKPEGVSRMSRWHEVTEERAMPDQILSLFCFVS